MINHKFKKVTIDTSAKL